MASPTDGLSDLRRTIAVDLLAHGDTEIAPDQNVSVTANAKMLSEFLDVLNIDKVDLVGNDSGGGISQIFSALYPERVRTLTLTNCDTHDNWPPEAFKPFVAMVKAGYLRGTLEAMLSDKSIYRSPDALGPAYEHPENVTDETIENYLRPFLASNERTRDLERFVEAFDNKHTVAIEPKLKTFEAPTLIVWGTDDIYFDVKWSRWLADEIPGTQRRVEFKSADSFLPKSARKNSTVNCAGFGNRLNNDKATLPFLFWQNGSDGSLYSGSQFKFLTNHLGEEMTTQLQKAKRFHKLHVPGEPLVLFNIWDPGSAKAVAETARWLSLPAVGQFPRQVVMRTVNTRRSPLRSIIFAGSPKRRSCRLPWMWRAVMETRPGKWVKRSLWPSRLVLSVQPGRQLPENGSLRETNHQVDRIRHARQKADETNVSFFINARTDVFIQVSQDEHNASLVAKALERAEVYAGAGAVRLFVPGLVDMALIAELTKASPLPVNIMVILGANIKCTRKARRRPSELRS